MRSRIPIAAGLVLAVCTFVLTRSVHRLELSRAALADAQDRLQTTESAVAEVLRLRSEEQRIDLGERPPQDLISLINSVMAESGIPNDRFENLQRETDSSIPGVSGDTGRYRRQTMGFSLARLSPREVGGFLREWEARQKIWTPTRIEFTHNRDQAASHLLYDVRILITATYLQTD